MSSTARLRDGLLLSLGTLSVVPVPPPRAVNPGVGAVAMTLAPLVGLGLGAAVAASAAVGLWLGLPSTAAAVIAVAAAALLTRFLHLDGLADTADGLMVAGDRDRALRLMRQGDVGPVGAATLVLVLGGQVVAVADLLARTRAPSWQASAFLVLAMVVSRTVLPLVTVRGVRAARPDGLGTAVVGSTPAWAAAVAVVVVLAGGVAALGWAAAAVVLVGTLGGVVTAARAHRHLGGLTGDVLGAAVELALLAGLLAACAVR